MMPGTAEHFVNLWMNELMFQHRSRAIGNSAREEFLETRNGLPRRCFAVRQWQRFRGNESVIVDCVQRIGNGRHVEMPLPDGVTVRVGEMNVADFVSRIPE